MTNGFRMTIGGGLGEVARVNAAFAEFADAHEVPAAVRRSVSVVLDELLANTIAYGLAGRSDGEATVEAELLPDRLRVTLTDDGRPFDPLAAAAPDTGLPVAERPVGGLGVHLVRRMMDDVQYHRQGDRNVLVLEKRLRGRTTLAQSGGIILDITTRTQGDVTIVALRGSLDSNTSPQAQQALDGILAAGGRKVALDFTALDYISSAGLRVLLGTAKRLSGASGALRLFGLNETVREVFQISGFATILAVFKTEAEALQGL